MSKKIYRVKLEYLEYFTKKELKVPCFGEVYGSFFFNWSCETAKQFINHIMSLQPTKFYISSTCEVEKVSLKVELFQKIMESYNKTGNKRIDKFELISIIPFIVSDNYENALSIGLNYFCLENEGMGLLTKTEFGFYIDSLVTSLHNILLMDEEDEIYKKTKNHIVKLGEDEIEKIENLVFESDVDEMKVSEVIQKIPDNIKHMLMIVNKGLFESLKHYNQANFEKKN